MFGCYVRVSTIGQNEDGQKAEIEKWLRGNKITDSRWYIDKESGDSLDRSAFARLQQDVFRGEVSCVVVWKLDRLSRSVVDGLNVLADWCDRGIRIVSVTQQLDFNGPLGKMLAAIFFGIAEMEQQTRRESASWLGSAWRNSRGCSDFGLAIHHEERWKADFEEVRTRGVGGRETLRASQSIEPNIPGWVPMTLGWADAGATTRSISNVVVQILSLSCLNHVSPTSADLTAAILREPIQFGRRCRCTNGVVWYQASRPTKIRLVR